jgi:hypothetical protein
MMRRSFTGNYPITRKFGIKDPAYANYPGSLHPGTDYGLPANTPLIAGMAGIVTIYDRDPNIKVGRGKEVKIEFANFTRKDCHMNRIDVVNGQFVHEGQQIGLSGNTGFSTGAHVHSELLVNGQLTDLEKYLKEENSMKLSTAAEVNLLWQLNGLRAPDEREVKEALGRELQEYVAYLLKTQPVKDNLAKVKFYDQDVKEFKEDAQAWRKFVKDVAINAEEDV